MKGRPLGDRSSMADGRRRFLWQTTVLLGSVSILGASALRVSAASLQLLRRNPRAAGQRYLNAAPVGIDARFAWTKTNGKGQGVGFVDIEKGWFLAFDSASRAQQHEDLPALGNGLRVSPGVPRSMDPDPCTHSQHHGSAVVGIVAGRDNTAGILGIAPRVDSVEVASHHSAGKNGLVASAIQKVLPFMKAGDVLLIEEQEGLNDPAEIKDETFGAISKAISAGIIVIEPAGNGNKNLDSRNTLNPAHPKFQDSGAIVVAACNRPDARGNGRTRWVLEPSDVRLAGDFPRLLPPCKAPDQPPVFPDEQPELVPGSNFGARVDCYAWGEGIVSAGYGWLEGTRGTNSYTNGFGGTSGAAAIVAGAAVLVQGLHKHAKGRPLTPAEMRDALRANGTPQQPAGATARIGVMPDVRKIANALNL